MLMTGLAALKEAIKVAGGQTALAKKLTILGRQTGLLEKNKSVSQKSVNSWVNRHKKSPAKYVHLIACAVDNKVTANQLRPDLYPVNWICT